MAEDIVRVAATAAKDVTKKAVKVLAYVANKKGNIIIPSDIKTKNNLNPNIQGFVGNNLYPNNVFTFKKTGNYKDYNKINVFPKNSEKMLWGDMSVTENNGGDRYRGVLSSYSSDNPKSSLDYSSFLYDLPQIQIREYLPDLPMDQWLNVFGETFK